MQVTHGIFKFIVLPLLLTVLVIGALVQYRAQLLAEQQVLLIEESFLAAKRAELKHYVDLARSSIGPLYDSNRNDVAAKNQAKAILQSLNYGSDGYFFVYDLAGNNLVHPRQPDLVGRNLWNLTDPQGRHVIRSLLEAAKSGDGYQRYAWEKPSTRIMTEKLAYVVLLEQWGWMMGTGIYLDDIEHTTRAVREHATATLQKLVYISLAAVMAVFACGLALSVREHRLAEGKLKVMTQRIVSLQDEERARVSRELHDGISQLLVSVKFKFELVEHKLASGVAESRADLIKGIASLADVIGEVRRISHDLHPALLDTLGLSVAITQMVTEFEQRTGIGVNANNTADNLTLPDLETRALFRITQEALSNVERHAAATIVTMTLSFENARVRLVISDNGRGFNVNKLNQASGIGLRNIRERIEHLGGCLNLSSEPGCTTLIISLPVNI